MEWRGRKRPGDNPVPDQPPRPLSSSAADDADEGCEGDGNRGPGGLHAHQVPMKDSEGEANCEGEGAWSFKFSTPLSVSLRGVRLRGG